MAPSFSRPGPSTALTTTANPTITSSSTRSLVRRPWTRLQQTLSLSNVSLTQPELVEELLLRVEQMGRPLEPLHGRSKESENRLRGAAGLGPDGTTGGGGPKPNALGKGGNPLLALAMANAAKEAEQSKPATDKDKDQKDKEEGAMKKLQTQLDGEFAVNSSMVEDALLLSEEFGIDEMECFVLPRSMERGNPTRAF